MCGRQHVSDDGFEQRPDARNVRRHDEPDGPNRQEFQQGRMSPNEQFEVIRNRRRCQEHEDGFALPAHADWRVIGEVAECPTNKLLRPLGRVRRGRRAKEASFVSRGRKPLQFWVRDDAIQNHQAVDDACCRHGFSVPGMRLTNRVIEPCMTHVIDGRAVVHAAAAHGVTRANQLVEEHVHLVAVSGSGKPRILPQNTHTTMQASRSRETAPVGR